MTFKSQIETDLDAFFNTNEFGESITYAGSSVTAADIKIERLKDADGLRTILSISVRVSEVAQPAYRDTVVYGGTTYYVMESGWEGDGYEWRIKAQTDERIGFR